MDSQSVNGSEGSEPTLDDRIKAAQQRLGKAALAQSMNPNAAAISAYLNTVINSARLDGVIAFLTTDYNASWTKEEAMDTAILASLKTVAEALEENARKIQVASRIVSPH